MIRVVLITALCAFATASSAGSQLERLVTQGLAAEGIKVDASTLSRSQLAALHLTLSSPADTPEEGDMRNRDALLAILNSETPQ